MSWYLYRFTCRTHERVVCTPTEFLEFIQSYAPVMVNNTVHFTHNETICCLWRKEYPSEDEAKKMLLFTKAVLDADPSGYILICAK